MKLIVISAAALTLLGLAACSKPKPPEPVYLQPTYDSKVGNPTCPSGYQLQTLDSGAVVCAPL